jgi:hypothetical protein
MLVGAGTGVDASASCAARSRLVSWAPWVRHGSFVMSRRTECVPEASVNASIVEVSPPESCA